MLVFSHVLPAIIYLQSNVNMDHANLKKVEDTQEEVQFDFQTQKDVVITYYLDKKIYRIHDRKLINLICA
jgi:hypothetical protein